MRLQKGAASIAAAVEQLELRTLLSHIAPDPNFGHLGDVRAGGSLLVTGVANNKILDVNRNAALRLNIDGSIDSSFKDAGYTAPKNRFVLPDDAVIQGSDVLIGGVLRDATTFDDKSLFVRALKLSDGSADTRFGAGGVAVFTPAPISPATSISSLGLSKMLATPDGGVILNFGQFSTVNGGNQFNDALYKLDSQGALDASFGTGGQLAVSSNIGGDSIAVDAQGRILMLGSNDEDRVLVTRYQSNGTLDQSFGTAGTLTLAVRVDGSIGRLKVDAQGRILFVQTTAGDSSNTVFFVRLNPDGSLDTNFNDNHGYAANVIDDYILDADGNITVISGDEIARIHSTGALDTSFDDDGRAALLRTSENSQLGVDTQGGYLVANGKHTQRLIARDAVMLLPNGVVNIAATEKDDDIQVFKSSSLNYSFMLNGAKSQFKIAAVKEIAIQAGGGDNSIDAQIPVDISVFSGGGSDSIQLGDGDNTVDGGQGLDTIQTGDGSDEVSTNGSANIATHGGDDVIRAENGTPPEEFNIAVLNDVSIDAGDGNDQISIARPINVVPGARIQVNISAGAGDDHVNTGGAGGTVLGGDGNDVIVVEDNISGADLVSLYGNGGADTIHGSQLGDYISGGGGNDRLFGEAGFDTLAGGEGRDHLYGDDGNDHVYGGAGGDWLYAGAGIDKLYGEAGDDRLYADDTSGRATLFGGAGNDTFVTRDGRIDVLYGDGGRDRAEADKSDVLTSIEGA